MECEIVQRDTVQYIIIWNILNEILYYDII